MNLNNLLEKVDTERMYQHVLNLEMVRHPLEAPENLNAAADYIQSELEKCGLPARRQTFQVEGFDADFYNIEGWLGDENAPAAVLLNHYDTVDTTLGANDNAAGIAVMLEVARVLAQEENPPNVRFLSVSLEEGHPGIESKLRQSAQALGLVDNRQRYTSYRVSKLIEKHDDLMWKLYDDGKAGKTIAQATAEATAQLADQLPESVLEYLKVLESTNEGITSFPGQDVHLGAWAWVDEALKLGKKIKYAISLDEIGMTSQKEGRQELPEPLTYKMMPSYKVDAERKIGNWAFIITDGAAEKLGQAFCAHCEAETIDLPYGYFHIPLNYEQIKEQFPQALGSDFTAFWNAGIPALFLFDTAGWRHSFGHSMADTIDRLDFDQITKICKATIATLVDPAIG